MHGSWCQAPAWLLTPWEATGEGRASTVVNNPGLKGSWRELEAWSHVAGSESLTHRRGYTGEDVAQPQRRPQHFIDASSMGQLPMTTAGMEGSQPEPRKQAVLWLLFQAVWRNSEVSEWIPDVWRWVLHCWSWFCFHLITTPAWLFFPLGIGTHLTYSDLTGVPQLKDFEVLGRFWIF